VTWHGWDEWMNGVGFLGCVEVGLVMKGWRA
jgi:hypothetical protein